LKNKGVVPMVKSKFEVRFSSNIYKAKQTVDEALSFIKESIKTLSLDDLYELKLILCELVYNAVIHGNKSNAEKNVNLMIEINGNHIFAAISDEGTGFDYTKLLSKLQYNDTESLYSETGRGIKLVLSLVDKISFNLKGNEIKFCKKVT